MDFLTRRYPDRFTPKSIARAIGGKPDSVRSLCSRLSKRGDIDCPEPRFYCAFPSPEKLPVRDLELHRITLRFNLSDCFASNAPPTFVALEEPVPSSRPPFNLPWRLTRGRGRQYMVTEVWRDRPMRLRWYRTTGTVTVSLQASERPLGHHDFLAYCQFWDGMFRGAFGKSIDIVPVSVSGIHFNYDLPFMRLEGVQDIGLKVFRNFWIRMYQKGGQLRIEECFEEELPLVYAVRLMESLGREAVELARMREGWKRDLAEYEERKKRDEEAAKDSDQTMFQ